MARGLASSCTARGRPRRARRRHAPVRRRHRRRRAARQRPRRRPLRRAPDRRAALAGRARGLLLRLGQLGPRLGLPQVAAAHDVAAQPDRRRPPRRQRAGLLGARRRPRGHHRAATGAPIDRDAEQANAERPTVLVLVEGDAPIDRSRLVAIAERGHRHGILVLWLAETQQLLPAACRTFLVVSDDHGSLAGFVHAGEEVQPVAVDRIGYDEAMACARRLAPVVDAGRAGGRRERPAAGRPAPHPRRHRPRELRAGRHREWRRVALDPHRPVRAGRAAAQARQPARRRRPVRARARSPSTSARDGPHALVGGTTGAGKSELLQSWILGMAAAHSPAARSPSCSSTTRAARRSATASSCRTPSASSPTSPHLVAARSPRCAPSCATASTCSPGTAAKDLRRARAPRRRRTRRRRSSSSSTSSPRWSRRCRSSSTASSTSRSAAGRSACT